MSKLNTIQAYSIQKTRLEMAVRHVETGGLELWGGNEGRDARLVSIAQVMVCHLTMLHSFHARSMTHLCSTCHTGLFNLCLKCGFIGKTDKKTKQIDALVSDFLFKKETIPKRVHRIWGDAILTKSQSKRKNLNWTVGAIIADLLKCLDRKAHVCTH